MPPALPFLEFAVAWCDEDIQEIVISASSGKLSAQVNVYGDVYELTRVAESLHGFPSSKTDCREVELGQDGLSGYGSVRIKVICTDSTGHIAFEVSLRSFPAQESARPESAVVVVPAAVGDLDRFVEHLRAANYQEGATAVLRSAA